MKFAIVADIHLGPLSSGFSKGIQKKLTSQAEKILQRFVKKMNILEHPEFVVNLGDSIEDMNDKKIDIRSFQKTLTILSRLKMPKYSLIGNHDVRTLSEIEIAKILGYKSMYYSFDFGLYHFIVLSLKMTGDHTQVLNDIAAEVPKKQLRWLKSNLSQTKKPVILFVHYGLAEDNMKGNFWFEKEPHYALLQNRQIIRKIIEESKKVKAVFSAHQHWNRMHIHKGIPYFTVTSLIENFKNNGVPTEAYAIVNLGEGMIKVKVKGNDPALYNYIFK